MSRITKPLAHLLVAGFAGTLALSGCALESDLSDVDPAEPSDPGEPTDPSDPNDPNEPNTQALTMAEDVAEAFAFTVGPWATMTGGLANSADQGTAVLNNIAIVSNPGCLDITGAPGSLRFDFDKCVLSANQMLVDGAIILAVDLAAREISAEFDNVALGNNEFYGRISAGLSDAGGVWELQFGLDLTYQDGNTTLIADSLSVTGSLEGVDVSGQGSLLSSADDISVVATDVHFAIGDCLPSGGTVSYDDQEISGSIRFLSNTPNDGVVELTIAPVGAFDQQVFEPCR
jgi:hypothetical protein